MEEKKKVKLELDSEMINELMSSLNEAGESYRVTFTNYACMIETKDTCFHFLKTLQRKRVFSVSSELMRYMESNIKTNVPVIERSETRYYSAKAIRKPVYYPSAWNIDINAAYPTCLLNHGLIDKKMYGKLMALAKEERLTAIGMLASRKRIFEISGGNILSYSVNESEFAKYFFYCVNQIHYLIWQCEIICGTSFIFSWVDGLYTSDKESALKCKKHLESKGYKASVSKLADFTCTPDEKKVKICFSKDGENKLFHIPVSKNFVSQILKTIHHDNSNSKTSL